MKPSKKTAPTPQIQVPAAENSVVTGPLSRGEITAAYQEIKDLNNALRTSLSRISRTWQKVPRERHNLGTSQPLNDDKEWFFHYFLNSLHGLVAAAGSPDKAERLYKGDVKTFSSKMQKKLCRQEFGFLRAHILLPEAESHLSKEEAATALQCLDELEQKTYALCARIDAQYGRWR